VAHKLSTAIGKTVTYVDVPLEAAKKALLDGGAPEWFAEGQMEQFRFRWQGRQSHVTSTIADVAIRRTDYVRRIRTRIHHLLSRGEICLCDGRTATVSALRALENGSQIGLGREIRFR
jgi:hypothetical protein